MRTTKRGYQEVTTLSQRLRPNAAQALAHKGDFKVAPTAVHHVRDDSAVHIHWKASALWVPSDYPWYFNVRFYYSFGDSPHPDPIEEMWRHETVRIWPWPPNVNGNTHMVSAPSSVRLTKPYGEYVYATQTLEVDEDGSGSWSGIKPSVKHWHSLYISSW